MWEPRNKLQGQPKNCIHKTSLLLQPNDKNRELKVCWEGRKVENLCSDLLEGTYLKLTGLIFIFHINMCLKNTWMESFTPWMRLHEGLDQSYRPLGSFDCCYCSRRCFVFPAMSPWRKTKESTQFPAEGCILPGRQTDSQLWAKAGKDVSINVRWDQVPEKLPCASSTPLKTPKSPTWCYLYSTCAVLLFLCQIFWSFFAKE